MLAGVIKHPNQCRAVGSLDLLAGAERSFRSGSTLVENGEEFGKVVLNAAADCRSASTLSRALKEMREDGVKVIERNADDRHPGRLRARGSDYDLHIPPDLRNDRAAAVNYLCPPAAEGEAKRHGGSVGARSITPPQAVIDQTSPVRRERRETATFVSLATGEVLAPADRQCDG